MNDKVNIQIFPYTFSKLLDFEVGSQRVKSNILWADQSRFIVFEFLCNKYEILTLIVCAR